MTPPEPKINLNGPGDLAEILPVLLGRRPENLIVLHGMVTPGLIHGPTMSMPLPADPAHWKDTAEAFVVSFFHTTRGHGHDVQETVVYLCRDPRAGQTAEDVAEDLRPLADFLVDAFDEHGQARVMSAIVLVDDRWWAYECPTPGCCEGRQLPDPEDPDSATARLAAIGYTVAPHHSEIAAEYLPATTNAEGHRQALDKAVTDMEKQTGMRPGEALTREPSIRIVLKALQNFHVDPQQLTDEEAARFIVGLQDSQARDYALARSEDHDLPYARKLWGHLARRCVPPHTDLAAPLLTLLGWVAWRQDDIVVARRALSEARQTDPLYFMAEVLLEAIDTGIDREELMEVFRNGGHLPYDDEN